MLSSNTLLVRKRCFLFLVALHTVLENISYSWHVHQLYVPAWAIVSEYVLSSPSAFLKNSKLSVGFISASRALKMGGASQLYYTDVAVIPVYILSISELRKRRYSQAMYKAVGCAEQWVWGAALASGGGNKCLSGDESSKWPVFSVGPSAGKKGRGLRLTRWGGRSREATRATVWFQDSPSCDAASWWGHLVHWGASLWATGTRPWQPLQELGI